MICTNIFTKVTIRLLNRKDFGCQFAQKGKYLYTTSSYFYGTKNMYQQPTKLFQTNPSSEIVNRQLSQINCLVWKSYSTDNNSISNKVSKKDMLKRAVKDYGSTVVVFHVSISLLSLGICYLLISSGVDMGKILEYLNINSSNVLASNAGTFVMAYAVHKIFAPVRMSITVAATPFIVRYLRKIGFLKNNVRV